MIHVNANAPLTSINATTRTSKSPQNANAEFQSPLGEPLKKVRSILKTSSSYNSLSASLKSTASGSALSVSISASESKNSPGGSAQVPPSPKMRRNISNVSFKTVDIREYNRTLGDNPSCSFGPPVSLDWNYSTEQKISLEDYEKHRGMRRTRYNMRLPARARESLVKMNLGYSDEEVNAVTKDIKKVQRSRSVNDVLSVFWRVEDMCQSAGRKIKRRIQKRDKKTRPAPTPYELSVELEISRSMSRSESLNDLGRTANSKHTEGTQGTLSSTVSLPQISNLNGRRSSMDESSLGCSSVSQGSQRSLGSSTSSYEATLQF
eukprot:CAMPEP_0204632768 /NCGR_PEP_ID=MMETSP0717-20131115/25649_1 /ASSEMBLY_ACC=CAM_ASM_000666 /TAXON_ID=230516 /ORGANISM="Chaetoceros curvisetus" /LENGTH=319 /DNA_ID=CAMNT_0051650713 /DNA_START=112 /DNA_END=1071 /DNA_ORIENTATION=-